jgi:hypothetical protein
MDVKKPTRYSEGRSRLNVPQRGDMMLRPIQRVAPKDETVTKKSKLPSKAAFRKLLSPKRIIIASTIVVAIIGCLIAGSLFNQHTIAKNAANNNAPNKIIENLEYQTVLPQGKSITKLGGWKRVSPPDSDPVFAYIDAINGIAISVSQQPLPQSFKDDVDNQVAELAKKFAATTKIDADGTTVYLGTSAKGLQSVIFTKNGLLILIKSQNKIDNNAWAQYAASLN